MKSTQSHQDMRLKRVASRLEATLRYPMLPTQGSLDSATCSKYTPAYHCPVHLSIHEHVSPNCLRLQATMYSSSGQRDDSSLGRPSGKADSVALTIPRTGHAILCDT